MMADEFYLHNSPALGFPFIELGLERLDRLAQNAQQIVALLEHAKRGAASLSVFQSRLHHKQAVRATAQNVKATAAARYAPQRGGGFDLSAIMINVFVDLVTYLPLAELKTLSNHADALRIATELLRNSDLNPRWGTYYTFLIASNKAWANSFFNGSYWRHHAIRQYHTDALESP